MGLTRRQQAVLEFIERHIRENGYPPTLREIGSEVGISSTSVVNYNLNVLQKKGLLVRTQEASRGLRLVAQEGMPVAEPDGATYLVPLAGHIAAGEPLRLPETDFSLTDDEAITLTRDTF
ncbi:MAG TPA: MarR family transcriptional regulator, partial [Anaerolineae bacterium]|nr:MarR family transcriptional regulator [Anaerolineae bacterium]